MAPPYPPTPYNLYTNDIIYLLISCQRQKFRSGPLEEWFAQEGVSSIGLPSRLCDLYFDELFGNLHAALDSQVVDGRTTTDDDDEHIHTISILYP